VNEMRIANSECSPVENEGDVIERLLTLEGASILELGCGKAEKTRFLARQAASILALEVDEIQLAEHEAIADLPNVRFDRGGAEQIPAIDASFDQVLMFKSLHHVPIPMMDKAFAEIHRVLKPGGVVYISEPVYAGDFNDILRLFHDEKTVRESAFAAEQRAIASGLLTLEKQVFFSQPMHFDSFDRFEKQVIGVTHTVHSLSASLREEVRLRFEKHMTPDGVNFNMPVRVDLFARGA
jgi:SAM-dependent methyltransferase